MKLYKHIGFIIESLFEAFPQSILQLIPILTILSISVSMISVCSKSFAFSVSVSINTKSVIFSWLCCATDFISIFCTGSIIFYGFRHEEHYEAFNSIQTIYIWKIGVCVIPMTLIGAVGVNLYFSIHFISHSLHHHNSYFHIIVYCVTV